MTGRDPSHVPPSSATFHALDRAEVGGLVGSGVDLLVDCVCYTADHARALLPLLGSVRSTVMISSKAVYVDDDGRHSNSDVPPSFAGPIAEDQPTLRPNDAPFTSREGYGANKVAAEEVLLGSGFPVTVLRPSKIHGAWSRQPREWVFVKRILDRRAHVFWPTAAPVSTTRAPPPTSPP